MKANRLAAIAMIVAGALALTYGGFSFTKERHSASVGALHMSVDEKQHVNVPLWAGLAVLVAGVLMLLIPKSN